MRFILIIWLLSAIMISCDNAPGAATATEKPKARHGHQYGQKFDAKGAITGRELKELIGQNDEINNVKVRGEVVKVCQAEGCWLTLDMGDGTTMHVNMKGHSFFVPKDLAGEIAIVEGRAFMDTTSVEKLRHYAEDEGKSEEEIAKISEPTIALKFDAEGVMIE